MANCFDVISLRHDPGSGESEASPAGGALFFRIHFRIHDDADLMARLRERGSNARCRV
jgi:hypothetical protein